MTDLTEAYERLAKYVESLPPSVREPLEVVLGVRCDSCKWWRHHKGHLSWRGGCYSPHQTLGGTGQGVRYDHGCRAWEKREEATA